MAAMIPEQGIGRAQVQGAGGAAETVAVPASALRVFLQLLTETSQGGYQTLRPRCRRVPIIRRPFAAGSRAPCAQDAAVPPLEGTVIRRLGYTNGHTQQPGCSEQPGCFTVRSAGELYAPAFSPARAVRTGHF